MFDDGDWVDRFVYCVCSGNMIVIRRLGVVMEVCCKGWVFEGWVDCGFEYEVVSYVVLGCIWVRWSEFKDFDGLVVVCCGKKFIGWVEVDVFDVILVGR